MSFRNSFRYRFDTFMAKGGVSIFACLVAGFLGVLLLLAGCRIVFTLALPEVGQQWPGLLRSIYITFLELTDPGNMAQDIESSPWYKVFAATSGICGVIIFSALIAFITTALDQKISELKRGHSTVIEKGHTLLLGWNEQRVVEIIRELIFANEDGDDTCVVILADVDKEEMDDTLRLAIPKPGNVRVVTRSGNISSMANLAVVSVETCKSVVILAGCDEMAPPREKATSDAKVIQTLLALTNMTKDNDDEDFCIVAEIFNPAHRTIVRDSFPEHVVTVDTCDILAKILVQTSRSVGLSVVYNEILSFDGGEMYFYHAKWDGIAFGELCYHFPDGIPMGIRHEDGKLYLRPSLDYKLKDDDEILILAEDGSTIEFRKKPVAKARDLKLAGGRVQQRIERELILGWTAKAPIILEQYADYVKPGSQIDIVLREPTEKAKAEIEAAQEELEGIDVRLVEIDPLNTEDLLSLEPFKYDNIIILAEGSEEDEAQTIDSENIVTLLLLREIFAKHREEAGSTKLITEVLDSQNHVLMSQAGVKDMIISNRLISMILAQISESRHIMDVYDDIFQEDGSEIYLKPVTLYFESFPVEVTYADMIAIAQKRDEEVCMGVKIKSLEEDAQQNFGVKLIPDKNVSYTLQAEDSLVVFAEDDM